jgi:hypothetical protein
MFYSQANPVTRFRRRYRLRKIAKQVRAGNVPKGIPQDEIFEALRITRPKGALEMFGILNAKHFRQGELVNDLGVVGVKLVTREFADLLVDAMCSSGAAALLHDFNCHRMGAGSTAEATGDQALVDLEDESDGGSQTHGATSNIYKSILTLTANSAYEVAEHGLFDTTGATDYLLDRTLLATAFNVITDDEVEWTYQLTVNTETG